MYEASGGNGPGDLPGPSSMFDNWDHAARAYDLAAPFYDDFTAHHDYDGWIDVLETLARDHGLAGRRLLDVACGTGKSTAPFLTRGYDVYACDSSEAMLARARERLGEHAVIRRADLRALGVIGRFDLVCCIDDGLNYLIGDGELATALRGLAAQLDVGGLLLFDVNTLATYRGFFAEPTVVETSSHVLVWQGRATRDLPASGVAEATLDAFALDGSAPPVRTLHIQRHHPASVVEEALAAAGLELVARRGHGLDGVLQPGADELRDTKVIYLTRARTG